MIVYLNAAEFTMLTLHLNIMKKPAKQLFKKNYGLFEGKKQYENYKSIIKHLEECMDENKPDQYNFLLDKEQRNLLISFLHGYINKLRKEGAKVGADLNSDTLRTLESVLFKVEEEAS